MTLGPYGEVDAVEAQFLGGFAQLLVIQVRQVLGKHHQLGRKALRPRRPCGRSDAQKYTPRNGHKGMTPKPGPKVPNVRTCPSRTVKIPGNRLSQPAFAAGTYWRAFASMPLTPGTCAARVTECTNDAPGQVRSCAHRKTFRFIASAAMSSDMLCPLHALMAAPE